MYQSLYRKYRPLNFDDVVGQDIVVRTLKNSILNNKINHAYLFSGPRGCGKTSIAKIFAKLVNCKNPNGTNPCNSCVCCAQQNEQNLDIIEMDAASNNGVDEIREINTKVNLVPSLGKYKVYIIDEVHMLTIGAFNALLKTLEEPPSHVIFILATTDPHKVPITIISRCQRFDFKKISELDISNRLSDICKNEKISITDDAIKEIAHLGDGSMRDALSILDQVISYNLNDITLKDVYEVNGTISQKEIASLIEKGLNSDIAGIIKEINYYSDNGKNMIRITEEIILFFRNFILAKTAPNMVEDYKCLFENIRDRISINTIINYIEILNETLLDMKKFNNSKMLLEIAFIKMLNLDILGNENINNKDLENKQQNFPGNYDVAENMFDIQTEDNKAIKLPKEKLDTGINNDEKNRQETKNIKQNFNDNILSRKNKFIDIRVSNALSKFSKKQTLELKEKLGNLKDYIMDAKLGNTASIVLDGEVKAVGENYIIFVYSTTNLVNLFIQNILNIENLLSNFLEYDYKVIAVDLNKWDEIKENFNLKKSKYIFTEEKDNINDLLKELNEESNDDIKSVFGDLVEYE